MADAGDLVEDGVVAQNRAQAERLWLYREIMVETQGRGGRYLRTDVSVPISRLADFVTDTLAALGQDHPEALAVTYGHIGDGNLHLNIVPPARTARRTPSKRCSMQTEAVIFDVVDRYGGSISAEHGIGRVKQKAFLERVDSVTLDLASRLKDALDPTHILSDGRILAPRAGAGRGGE